MSLSNGAHKALPIRYAAGLIWVMLMANQAFAQIMSEPIRVRGQVASVTADGDIVVMHPGGDSPTTLRLWGLRISDRDSLETFIVDRVVYCEIIYYLEDTAYAVCNAATKEFRLAVREPDLQLSVWLPELGWAEPFCTTVDLARSAVMPDGRAWGCTIDGIPIHRHAH